MKKYIIPVIALMTMANAEGIISDTFQTTHPYANNEDVTQEICVAGYTGPARVTITGELENNYDFVTISDVDTRFTGALDENIGVASECVTVHFTSDSSVVKDGITIHIDPSEINERDTFETAHPYANNEDVTQEICVAGYTGPARVTITGELENNYDFVTISDVDTRFTGALDENIGVASECVTVHFTSDSSVVKDGITIHIDPSEINERDTFETAHPYANNEDVTQEICVADGYTGPARVTITGELENNYDFVTISDVDTRYTGVLDENIGVASECVTLHFTSDSSVVKDGITIHIDPSEINERDTFETAHPYANNEDVTQEICVAGYTGPARVTITGELENNYDFVTISDVDTRFTGALEENIGVSSECVTVHFTSDSSVVKDGITIHIDPSEINERDTFETAHPYANNEDVTQEICVADGYTGPARVTITGELENNYDFVTISDVDTRFTGALDENIGVASECVTVHFTSDSSVVKDGIVVHIEEEGNGNPCLTRAELEAMIAANEDVTDVNTSCITDMSGLFIHNHTFNQDISGWDVSNVTDMTDMFSDADNFNQPLNDWNVSNVTDMIFMFADADNFNQPLNDWDVSNVTAMDGMFLNAHAFNQPINNWNVSNVTDHIDFALNSLLESANNPFEEVTNGSIISISPGATSFEGSPIIHSVALEVASVPMVYDFSIEDNTTTAGEDYNATPTFTNGVTYDESTQKVTVPAGTDHFEIHIQTFTDNNNYEDFETYNIHLGTRSAMGRIGWEAPGPNYIRYISNATGQEGDVLVHQVQVEHYGGGTADSFIFKIEDNTTTAGVDYNAVPTFTNGVTYDESTETITVPVGVVDFEVHIQTLADSIVEGSENYQIIVDSYDLSPTGTIYDNVDSNETNVTADIQSVSVSGEESNYTFSVTLKSSDLNCTQYADWWEVLSEDGELLYRRVLGHSHVDEQPFTRTGGPVDIQKDQTVYIRAHMNTTGYAGNVFVGTVESQFTLADNPPSLSDAIEQLQPLPTGCAF